MPLIALIIIFVCIPLAILALILRRAPHGYEDSGGFHFIQSDGDETSTPKISPPMRPAGNAMVATANRKQDARQTPRQFFRPIADGAELILLPRL